MQIAQFELAGNEWLEEPVVNPVTGDTTVYLSASTINTYDNPEDYNPPPGVLGEIDPIYDIRSKEQSLVIELLDLPTGAEGQLTKVLLGSQYHSYLEYKQLKMFVNGGGRNPEALNGKDLVMFFRFGSGLSGANRGYYEYTQRLQKGWAANEIVIDIDRLTRLKKEAEVSGTAEEVLSNGDIVRVVGKPSLGSIKAYAIGVRNLGTPVREEEGIEIWVDELRLSGVRKEPGMAMRTSVDAEFADFLDVHADLNQQDADFHRVDQRTSTTQSKSTIGTTVSSEIKLSKFIDPALGINLPVSGTMRHSLEIPKYISSNSDIRTESIAGEEKLNIWERFFDMAFSRDHLKDKYLLDSLGKPVEENGILKQDLAQWGIDTLFSTEQEYSWRTSFSKSKPSGNFFLHYTVDKLAPSFNHSQKYSSNLRNQYSKNFTNSGKLSYNLPFDKAELKILGWTDKIPVVNKLSDTQFNYLPTRINVSLESSETRSSQKLRNAAETPTYRLNLSRNISTSVKPFSTINMDYSYTVRSELVKEDSTRQQILYTDQPDSLRNLAFAPGTHPREFFSELLNHNYTKNDSSSIIIGDFLAALETARATWTGQDSLNAVSLLSQVRQDSSEASQGLQRWSDVLTNTYQELRLLNLPGWEDLKEPWEYVSVNDPWFKDKFLKIGGMFFLDTQKDQRITANFNPTLVNWFTTGFNYSCLLYTSPSPRD